MHLIEVTKKSNIDILNNTNIKQNKFKTLYFISDKIDEYEIYQEAWKVASNDISYQNLGFDISWSIVKDESIIFKYFDGQIDEYENKVKELNRNIQILKNTKNEILKSKTKK